MSVASPSRPSARAATQEVVLERPMRYPDAASRVVMTRRGWWLIALNFLIPGSAQVLAGNRRLGRVGIASTLVLWVVLLAKRGAIRRIRTCAARSERLRIRGIDLRPFVADTLERLVGFVNLAAIAAALYVWLGYCLALFPYTEPWGRMLGAYLSGLLHDVFRGIAGAVPDLVVVAIIFFVTRGITRTITAIVQRIERRAPRVVGFTP